MAVGYVTLLEIGDAIATKLAEHASLHSGALSYVAGPEELQESVPGEPYLQVYPDMAYPNVGGENAIKTYKATAPSIARHLEEQHWRIDLYARQRRHIGEDMYKLLPLIDAVMDQLALITNQPNPFDLVDDAGVQAIKTMDYRWERVTFTYGEPGLPYVGARFYLTLRFI
jgi:hypothetical protein